MLNKGQSLIGIIIILIAVVVITGGLFFYLQKQIPEIPEIAEKPVEEEIVKPEEEVVTPPLEEVTPPPEKVVKPKEEVTPPPEKVVKPKEEVTPPEEELPKEETHSVEYWAVIFGTDGVDAGQAPDPVLNHLSSAFKDMLVYYGWKEDQIKYFNGRNATYANVMTALDWLTNNTGPNDIVLFYGMAHGDSNGLYLDRFLAFSKIAEKLDKIRYSGLVIIIGACYSGGAIPILKQENRVIMTSARSDEISTSVFSYRVLAALQGFGDIEGNNNEWVSAREIFNFVQTRYPGPQITPWPQIQDDYPGELNLIFLDGYWRHLDQLNMPKGKHSFTGSTYLGGSPLVANDIRIYAQSFQPNYPVLIKAMLGVSLEDGVNPGPLTVSIRQNLSGPDLTSTTLNQNMIHLFSPKLYEFDFPDIEVVPNDTYYLVASVRPAKDDYYNLWISVGDYPKGIYPRGTTFLKGISPLIPWTNLYTVDLYFATFGKPKEQ